MIEKLGEFAGLALNFFRKPVTVDEGFGFVSESFRWLPQRDAEKCTGCGACNERCSSGATSITDSGFERTISIDGLRCIFCGRCVEVCPERALESSLDRTLKIDNPTGTVALHVGMEQVSMSRGSEEPRPTTDTTLKLQKCSVCGEAMPVTEKYLDVVKERTLKNLKPETAAIVEKDMERYLRVCIACRRKYSLEWDTHPRKFI